MPDTGPPFNLPFPAPSDLVRNGPAQFEALADATADALDNVGADFEVATTDTVNLDFTKDLIISRLAAGDVTFIASNFTEGRSVTVRVVAGASDRNLTFPADFVFVSFKPTVILSGKTAVFTATCFGASESDVIAAFAVEA